MLIIEKILIKDDYSRTFLNNKFRIEKIWFINRSHYEYEIMVDVKNIFGINYYLNDKTTIVISEEIKNFLKKEEIYNYVFFSCITKNLCRIYWRIGSAYIIEFEKDYYNWVNILTNTTLELLYENKLIIQKRINSIIKNSYI